MAIGRVFYDGTVGSPRLDHPECVAVHPDGSVWCGGELGQIYRLDPDGARLEVFTSTDGFVLGIAFDRTGERLYACDLAHRAVFRVDIATRTVERFADGAPQRRLGIPNYPVVSPTGDVYVSDSNAPGEPGPGIFRFAPDGTAMLWWAGPLNFANGLALAPDGRALYVVESFLPGISRVAIRADGSAGAYQQVVEIPSTVPDGITFGPDGLLYVGCYEPSQILRVDVATGKVATVLRDETAHLLCHPTNLAFRGDQLFAANLGRWHITLITDLD